MDSAVTCALVLGALAFLLFLLYRKLTSDYGYWESLGVPCVKPRFPLGIVADLLKGRPSEVADERFRKYGRVYGSYLFLARNLNISDPELVNRVLVKDFHIFVNKGPHGMRVNIPAIDNALQMVSHEKWKRIRSVVSPSFTTGKLRKMNHHFVHCGDQLIKNFSSAAEAQEPVDLKKYFACYILDVLSLCVFGIRVDSLNKPDHPLIVNTRKMFYRNFSMLPVVLLFIPGVSRILSSWVMKKVGFEYFFGVCEEIIQKRKNMEQPSGQVDLMQLLLDAREGKLDKDEKGDTRPAGHSDQEEETSKPRPVWNVTKTLSDIEIHAQAWNFFAAGYVSTSTALGYAGYELALNPDVQERAFQEVKQAYEAHGEFTYDVVTQLEYLDALVCETLRLHTIALTIHRPTSEDYVMGSTGILVPKGAIVTCHIHVIHHDPEYYPEPYKFNPDRFLPENRSSLTPHTFIPFADGPRNCVAMKFALLEMKMCLAMTLRKIKFVATEETRRPLEFTNFIGLVTPKQIKVGVEIRDS